MTEYPIPEDLKRPHSYCRGTGHVIEPAYHDSPARETSYDCLGCGGRGWVWALTQDGMADRIAKDEAGLAALAADLQRSDALLQDATKRLLERDAEIVALKAELAEADFDFGGWRAIKKRLETEIAALKLAYGLALSLHGCGGENCTEAAYLKDADVQEPKL